MENYSPRKSLSSDHYSTVIRCIGKYARIARKFMLSHVLIFPFNSLRFISSYSKGQSMKVVHVGVPSGEKILDLFGGNKKKKVFMHWKRKKGE